MTGAQHIVASTGFLLLSKTIEPKFEPILEKSANLLHQTYISPSENSTLFLIGFIALYYLGTILPDIDLPNATISRLLHFHIPVEHRTWTHAIWIPILIFIGCLKLPILFGLLLGYLSHLICDAVSVQGICFFYPISNYVSFSGNVKLKNNHYIKLYSTTLPITGWFLSGVIFIIGVTAIMIQRGIRFHL